MGINWRQLLAFLLVVLVASGATFEASNQGRARDRALAAKGIERDRAASMIACRRVQVLRDQTNALTLVAYDSFQAGYRRELQLIKKDPKAAVTHRRSARTIRLVTRTFLVTGPTNCNQAVDHPDHYRAPGPSFIWKGGPVIKNVRARTRNLVKYAKTHHSLPPINLSSPAQP